MKKIAFVAKREFISTVATRGFIIGVLMMPMIMVVAAVALPRLMNQKQPQVRGEIVLIDPTGSIIDRLKQQLDPRQLAEQQAKRIRDATKETATRIGMPAPAMADDAIARFLGEVPNLKVEARGSTSDLDASIGWLKDSNNGAARLAVIAIHPNAVANGEALEGATGDSSPLGGYDFYISPKLDERTQNTIQSAVHDAIVAARLKDANIDKAEIDVLVNLSRATPKLVSPSGGGTTNARLNRGIPFLLIGFLIFGVMMGAGSLLSTTVEEKFSRVLEVLLSAVSPFELMAGKILGQLAVSGVVLMVYVTLGLIALSSFAMLGLIDPMLLVYLFLFFVINYLIIGAFMGAIGAAVNDMRDAQSLLLPVNLLIMLPWFLAAPIMRNPESTLSTVLSFVPPVNCFAMLLRLASNSPPPFWQVALSIVISLATVYVALWFAAKIFRIAILLQGKPPNLITLIRWAKAA